MSDPTERDLQRAESMYRKRYDCDPLDGDADELAAYAQCMAAERARIVAKLRERAEAARCKAETLHTSPVLQHRQDLIEQTLRFAADAIEGDT
jgi:hypothetical protein